MHIAETFIENGYRVRIIADEDRQAPDEWGDENVILVTTRNRYFVLLHKGADAAECAANADLNKGYWSFPVYAYIHSGVALSLDRRGQFGDPWDSGRIGTLYLAKSEWRYLTRNTKRQHSAESYAKSHIETWNQYLSGDVWGYQIETPEGKLVDSLWGLYGLEYARQEAKANVPKEPALVNGESEDEAAEETLA